MNTGGTVNECSLFTILKNLHKLTNAFAQILQHRLIIHQSLICAIVFNPEVLHAKICAHLPHILRALPLCLGGDDHSDTLFFQNAARYDGWPVPEHQMRAADR